MSSRYANHRQMRRRLLLAGGAVLALKSAIALGQRAPFRIGVPFSGWQKTSGYLLEALKQGMREQGYPDSAVIYDVAYAEGRMERIPSLVREMVARKPDVLVVATPPNVRAALDATRSIPVVMTNVSDVVRNKFVASLAQPGGNATGIVTMLEELLPKTAEILHELAPRAQRIAVLVNESNPSHRVLWESTERGLRSLGKAPMRFVANKPEELDSAMAAVEKWRAQGMVVVGDTVFFVFREKLATLILKARIPAGFVLSEHVDAGGLFSYGANFQGNYRQTARFIAKILKGANPGEIPVEQPTQFELVLNLKTAKALGIAIPQSVRIRTDRVIE